MRLLTLVCLVALAGCKTGSHQPAGTTLGSDSTLSFTSANVTVERSASDCGVTDPPFTDSDVFGLDIIGAGAMPSAITISSARTVPLGSDLSVELMPFGIIVSGTDANGNMFVRYGQNGSVAAGNLHFGWLQGDNPDEIDSKPLTSVDVQFVAFPQQDGDDVDVRIKMLFEDGGLLDLEARAPLVTGFSGCPAG